MASERTMLCFDIGRQRFVVRAAAIFRRDGHILIHRATQDPFWCLPGGRVELGETTATTLAREIEEEMATTATVGPLRFVVENFFDLDGRRFQELGFYYDVALTGPFPFAADGDVCFRARDGDMDLEFAWVRPEETRLRERDFKPIPLQKILHRVGGALEHFVMDET